MRTASPGAGSRRIHGSGHRRGRHALLALVCVLVVGRPSPARPAGAATGGPGASALDGPAAAADRPEAPGQAGRVTVASKPFAESYLLAEVFAQLLEARGFDVDRRPGLGATEITFQALRAGGVDVYPEYTGTGLVAILGEEPDTDPARVLRRVRAVFLERWGAVWLAPLGFQNTYAITIRRETAERLGLRTLSDLAEVAPDLVGGFSPDFIGREDGLPGIRGAYGLRFGETRSLLQAVKYQALAEEEVDVIDGYSTDGQIARYDLVVLEDDRGFFPAYEAVPLAGPRLVRELPGAVAALTELSGLLDEAIMRRSNERIEVEGIAIEAVAADLLRELGLVPSGARARPMPGGTDPERAGEPGPTRRTGVVAYMWSQRADLVRLTLRHLLLVGVSLMAAILIAVPLGLALERFRSSAEGAIRGVGLLQTIPSIALLAFMIPLLGIGVAPALVALFLYSLYPILRNTYTGVRDAGPAAVDAARALGMTPLQVLRHVRLPLAAPIIMAGIRTAAVITVGTATLAAFIGAGGLGDPIVSGLALSDTNMILAGAIPAALLALVVDLALHGAERLVTPKGVS